ncbi:hypothetical protein C8F04DRAFT_1063777 [Mycena alexandri]|uniref:Uncharacterized protein n=1 Tax=Mycena alexandri TaxID=1745969 RepID=A0AAD6THC4_9AGAR|nr:hypothetical protein C8F04DRAFT_1063777 [Mycena alexandri]
MGEPSTSTAPTRAIPDFHHTNVALDAAQGPRQVAKVGPSSVESLAAHGVKVRDFAYESTLAPIKHYVRRPTQTRPSSTIYSSKSQAQLHKPRALKRTRRDGTEETDLGYGFIMGVARVAPEEEGEDRPRKLQRTTKEPLLPELRSQPQSRSQPTPRRESTVLNIDEEAALRATLCDVFGGSQPESQCTELIRTPFVTPNGSLRWT